jgi:hypothetical protein
MWLAPRLRRARLLRWRLVVVLLLRWHRMLLGCGL